MGIAMVLTRAPPIASLDVATIYAATASRQ